MLGEVQLNSGQLNAISSICDWYKNPKRTFIFSGCAGSGKTLTIAKCRDYIDDKTAIAFCSFTGKATSVLRKRLIENNCLKSLDSCSTIHSLIYIPVVDSKTKKIIDWKRRDSLDTDLIIIDEASMVDQDMYKDLCKYNIPILAVGDSFQLPPINGNFSLLDNPDILLTKICRQAENHPIIKVSKFIREEGYLPFGVFGENVAKVRKGDECIYHFLNNTIDFKDTIILCGTNKTRIKINNNIRKMLKFEGKYPNIGERVICLKNNRNAKNCPIYNGVTGSVVMIADFKSHLETEVEIDGELDHYFGAVDKNSFLNLQPDLDHRKKVLRFNIDEKKSDIQYSEAPVDYFDFSYAITVHKSQGSEYNRVMVIEEWFQPETKMQWLYTSCTRSKEQLLIVER